MHNIRIHSFLLFLFTVHFSSASSDFTAQNNTYQFSSNVLLQCIPIGITSDSVDEPGQECFTFSISSQRSIPGLTISPSEAKICISDFEGINYNTCIIH